MRNGHTLVWHYAATVLVTGKIALFPFAYTEIVRNLKIEFASLCEYKQETRTRICVRVVLEDDFRVKINSDRRNEFKL